MHNEYFTEFSLLAGYMIKGSFTFSLRLGSCPHEPYYIILKMVRGDTNQGEDIHFWLILRQPISGRDKQKVEDNFRQPVFWQTPC